MCAYPADMPKQIINQAYKMHKYLSLTTHIMAEASRTKKGYDSQEAQKSNILDILAMIKELRWDAPAELPYSDDFIEFDDAPHGTLTFNKMLLLKFIKMSLNAPDAEIRDSAIDAARLLTERDNPEDKAKSLPKNWHMINLLKDYSDEMLGMNEYDAFGNGLVLSSFFNFENIHLEAELKIFEHINDLNLKVKFSAYEYFFRHKHSMFYQKTLEQLPNEIEAIKYLFIKSFSSSEDENESEIKHAMKLIGDESAHISLAATEAFYLRIGHAVETGTFDQSIFHKLSAEAVLKILSIVKSERFSDSEAECAIKILSMFITFCSPSDMKGTINMCMDSIYAEEVISKGPISFPRFAFGASAMQLVLDLNAPFKIRDKAYADFKALLSDFEHYKSFETLYSNKLLGKHLNILDIYSNYKDFNWGTWTNEEKSAALELGDTLAVEEAKRDAFYRLVFRISTLDK